MKKVNMVDTIQPRGFITKLLALTYHIQTDSGPTFVTVIIFFLFVRDFTVSFVHDFTVMINFPNTFAYFRFEKSWCEITV